MLIYLLWNKVELDQEGASLFLSGCSNCEEHLNNVDAIDERHINQMDDFHNKGLQSISTSALYDANGTFDIFGEFPGSVLDNRVRRAAHVSLHLAPFS